MRFVNVAQVTAEDGSTFHFDLELTTTSDYTPFNSSLNTFKGCLAQINLDCDQSVDLRVTMVRSCATEISCAACSRLYPRFVDGYVSADMAYQRGQCFARGCSCYGKTVYGAKECDEEAMEQYRQEYSCESERELVILPSDAMVSMTVYDFDTGQNGTYLEQLTVPRYEYYTKPLRPASGRDVQSSVFANADAHMFTGTARGNVEDAPTSPTELSDAQAERGVQFFFRPEFGFVDATFTVKSTGGGQCSGSNLLFAGDSALCAPPPPLPPSSPVPPGSPPLPPHLPPLSPPRLQTHLSRHPRRHCPRPHRRLLHRRRHRRVVCLSTGDPHIKNFWNKWYDEMGLGVHLLAGIPSGPSAFEVQAFQCPAYCPFCFASGNVGLAIKYGADVVTIIGGNVSINGEPYAGDLFEVAAGLTVSRGPPSALKWKRTGISRVARVHLDLGNQHVFLDSQEYKTPHMPTGNLQNVRLQASGNLALSYTNSIVTGLCARRSETESDPLPRSEYLFSDDEVYALESTCGMLAGGSAQANYQTAPATPAEACAMSGTSIDEATVTCANLAVDRAAHTNCMFDFCAMGGDETAVTAGIGAIMDNSDAAVISENATAEEIAQSIFSAFSNADNGLMTFNVTICPAGTEPIRPLPIILTAEELQGGSPACRLCDVGYYESNSVCQVCPDGSTSFEKGASVCTFLQPPTPPRATPWPSDPSGGCPRRP